MRLELDEYEKDTLIETIQYRMEEDEHLLVNASLKSDLKDLLDKFGWGRMLKPFKSNFLDELL